MDGLWNGKAYCAYYRLNAGHTGILAADGTGSVIGTPATTDAALILEDDTANDIIVQSTDWSPDAKGVHTATVETSASDVVPFLEVAAPAVAGSANSIEKKEYKSEAGGVIGGAGSSSGVPYLVISAMSYNDAEVLTNMAIVTLSPESGKIKTGVGEVSMWGVKQTSVAAKAAFVIPQALFPGAIYGTISAGDRTIPVSGYIKSSLLPAA